jgi:ribonuclease HII
LSALDDSKRVRPEVREHLAEALWRHAAQVVVVSASAATIDRDGLHRTNLRLLRRALAALSPCPETCLVDGFRLGPLAPPHRAIVDGDARSAAIAAASIIAKTVRDRLMSGPAASAYPGFGFDRHVGYATPEHHAALRADGLSPLHRRSFQSVAYPELLLFDP